jgi:SAM-dependent methyltransferase
MNVVHRLYCRSGRWRTHLEDVLPWATAGVPLAGQRVLEIGSGPGLTTEWLQPQVASLVAVELDAADASALAARMPDVDVRQADATELPFADGTFDTVVCFTMLHHVPSVDLQDRLLSQAHRVLRPGGAFAGSDSLWGPLFAVAHARDVMQLIDPATFPDRLSAAGFHDASVDTQRRMFRFRATA